MKLIQQIQIKNKIFSSDMIIFVILKNYVDDFNNFWNKSQDVHLKPICRVKENVKLRSSYKIWEDTSSSNNVDFQYFKKNMLI